VRFDALSSGPYRRFWLGSIASVGSTQLYFLGMAWLVFELSDSALDLGLLGAATAVPTILATLAGGLVADRINRRSVLILASVASAFSSVFLVSSMTVLQLKVPDNLRGRVMGIHSITFSMIALGGLAIGALATKFSAPVAVVIGAVVVLSSLIWVTIRQGEITNLDGSEL